ncbi:Late promoter-activating protein [Escherichia coli]|uniref:Late promoter-activating protein n=1 Tax=Escherichia coli TaxID=562 RepID=UPI002A36EFDD|nr:Late promoter-activating protein [Escherichia coli]
MIRTKSLLSAKELAAILEKEYPHLDVDKRDVYLRLKAIAVSKYSSVLIDDSTRPRRFQIHSLNPEFFRRSRAPRRFDEKLQNELYRGQFGYRKLLYVKLIFYHFWFFWKRNILDVKTVMRGH